MAWISTFSCEMARSTSADCSGVRGRAASYLGSFFAPMQAALTVSMRKERAIFRNVMESSWLDVLLDLAPRSPSMVERGRVDGANSAPALMLLRQLERNGDVGGRVHCLAVARRRAETNLLRHT